MGNPPFNERCNGPCTDVVDRRVFESPRGDGYIAAAVVKRLYGAPHASREVWRDDSLACGHRWASAKAALRYAMARAREIVRSRAKALAS